MTSELKEPENRPKERIEQLINKIEDAGDRRMHERIPVEPGAEVFFPIICRGEVANVSDQGISIRFRPAEALSLELGEMIRLSMPLENHSFEIPAEVKRVESRFGVILLGLKFDPDSIKVEE
jgi:hypothetical protein